MKPRLLIAALAAATTVILPFGAGTASATEEPDVEWAPLDGTSEAQPAGDEPMPDSETPDHRLGRQRRWPGRSCVFRARADYVHMSTTKIGDISAHGA